MKKGDLQKIEEIQQKSYQLYIKRKYNKKFKRFFINNFSFSNELLNKVFSKNRFIEIKRTILMCFTLNFWQGFFIVYVFFVYLFLICGFNYSKMLPDYGELILYLIFILSFVVAFFRNSFLEDLNEIDILTMKKFINRKQVAYLMLEKHLDIGKSNFDRLSSKVKNILSTILSILLLNMLLNSSLNLKQDSIYLLLNMSLTIVILLSLLENLIKARNTIHQTIISAIL
ncbi:hypothetical protein ACFPDQ_00290 [Pseudofrancisella aestuarii]|uniref:Uncharacterized protein n=1 Tax=Pseudofrancisella aestuarii TaxID=2670347 RepID=A0ABV9T9Q7_9GAMM|nr:hypothetical protein [Pseudofrancisella aestuarii]